MARKTNNPKTIKNTQPKRAIDDNYVAPKRKPRTEKVVTLAEALAESGETMEELRAQAVAAPDLHGGRLGRPVGTSNLANTIRSHRGNYTTMLRGDKKTQNNGDDVARLLLPIPLATLQAFSITRFGKAYDHLNPGHARMCIGNLIRAAVKKGETDVIEWLNAQQPVAE